MAWIKIQTEAEATGDLAGLYSQEKSLWGDEENLLKVHSLNPASLEAHLALYKTLIYGKSGVTRIQREMIGTVVSSINQCKY